MALDRYPVRLFAAAVSGLMAFVASPVPGARAATFSVTNTNDSGVGSLRQAVIDASAAAGADTVIIPAGLGTITLASTIDVAGADLTTIEGNANAISFTGGTAFSSGGGTPYALEDLTIIADRGASSVDGDLTIMGTTLDVTTQAATTGGGDLTIAGSTISSDNSGATTAGGSITVTGTTIGIGPGVGLKSDSGPISMSDSKITSASDGDGLYSTSSISVKGSEVAVGGDGVANDFGGVEISFSAVIGTGTHPGKGVRSARGSVLVHDATVTGWNEEGLDAPVVQSVFASVVANGTDPGTVNLRASELSTFASVLIGPNGACNHPATHSSAFDYANDDTCGLLGPGDTENGGDPGLAALADNGGNSRSLYPQSGSPLINAVSAFLCQGYLGATDQRGRPRVSGATCDIGAIEVQIPRTSTSTSTASTLPSTSPVPVQAAAVSANPEFTG